ncbi:hypothetical protein GQ600_12610 [Phytophthora cactorum]|nr:hypothetical protein GQ600_12610 [Phytophthora cactorum]
MEEVFLNAAGRGDLYVMECLFNLDCNFKSLLEKTLRKDSARTLPYRVLRSYFIVRHDTHNISSMYLSAFRKASSHHNTRKTDRSTDTGSFEVSTNPDLIVDNVKMDSVFVPTPCRMFRLRNLIFTLKKSRCDLNQLLVAAASSFDRVIEIHNVHLVMTIAERSHVIRLTNLMTAITSCKFECAFRRVVKIAAILVAITRNHDEHTDEHAHRNNVRLALGELVRRRNQLLHADAHHDATHDSKQNTLRDRIHTVTNRQPRDDSTDRLRRRGNRAPHDSTPSRTSGEVNGRSDGDAFGDVVQTDTNSEGESDRGVLDGTDVGCDSLRQVVDTNSKSA